MRNRILLNSVTNVGNHFFRLFVGIFLTPFLISRLGNDVYGLMPLVNSITAYIALISVGIQSAVGRYVTMSIAQEDYQEANRYLNTGFFMIGGLVLLAVVPFLLIVFYFPSLFNVPPGLEVKSQWVMFCVGLNFIINILFSPFTVAFWAKQRFDLENLISVIGQMVHVVFIVMLFLVLTEDILVVAVAVLFSGVLSTFLRVVVSKRLYRQLSISYRFFDKEKVARLMSFGGWMFITSVSVIVLINTDYIIINNLIDSTSVTDYSLAKRWEDMVRSVITSAFGVLVPVATHLGVAGDYSQLVKICLKGTRITLALTLLPTFLLAIFSRELLVTWVGPGYEHLVPLFCIALLPMFFEMGSLPGGVILRGLGQVKVPAMVSLGVAVTNIFLSIYFIRIGWGIAGVAFATVLVLFVKNTLFVTWYTSHILSCSVVTIYAEYFRPLCAAVPMVGLALFLKYSFDCTGWPGLVLANIPCVLLFLIVVYYYVLDSDDRQGVCGMMVALRERAIVRALSK
ncbi:oligosaccharide flippase family protein [Desulfogranum mediterraneum]|uniref:oligosaccharide flippase family protein n=1 Tax=Desulfogranum mediterraneum TaxID=160661 RepID=UPI0012948152|nr:oligosaccharide flippase family protein [Desulfogranum mediterraneum]